MSTVQYPRCSQMFLHHHMTGKEIHTRSRCVRVYFTELSQEWKWSDAWFDRLISDLSWSDLEQRIPQTFQDWVGFQNLLLDPRVFAGYCCQVLQDEFSGLRLPGTGLPGDDNALVLASSAHQGVTVVSDGENMRGQLSNLFLLVQLDLLSCIDRQNLKRYKHKYILTYVVITQWSPPW